MSYSFAIVLSAFFGLLIVVLKSAIHGPQLAPRGLIPFNKVTVKEESAPVTPVRDPRFIILGLDDALIN